MNNETKWIPQTQLLLATNLPSQSWTLQGQISLLCTSATPHKLFHISSPTPPRNRCSVHQQLCGDRWWAAGPLQALEPHSSHGRTKRLCHFPPNKEKHIALGIKNMIDSAFILFHCKQKIKQSIYHIDHLQVVHVYIQISTFICKRF